MTWDNITLQQFQQLSELWLRSEDCEPLFVAAETLEIVLNLTRQQVDALPTVEVWKLYRELAFLHNVPDWKPVRGVTVDGRRYRFVYDVRQIHAARNIEVKHFAQGEISQFIQNMHKAAASMVIPQRRHKWLRWRWIDDSYDAARHEQYANDLKQAPISAVYGSAVFFCEVWKTLIGGMSDYLISQIPTEMRGTAKRLLLDSCKIMGGTTTPNASPSSNASQ